MKPFKNSPFGSKLQMLSIKISKLKKVNIINLCCAGFIISGLYAGRSTLKQFVRTILRRPY
ncbi:MAG: hypothetical protein JSV88_14725, partial [Candidatus Aminicenantes bacterium]